LKIFRQIIDAMSFGYVNLQISHSDIKPANILKINDDFYIKITDYGTSRILICNSKR